MLKEEVGGRRPFRPPQATERFAVAVENASAGSSTALRRHARRYSLCAADAEDACQRGLEILLTKAPAASRSELRAWLFTVVKHEALALRRQRERAAAAGSAEDVELFLAGHGDGPAERASDTERARRAAEALAHLKPAEMRCMLLKAMGFSYEEISERTGFSFTKVNRSLTEGRRRFLERFARLSAGAGCEELRPMLSAASDGECAAPDLSRLRAHLDACASCRATLRAYREAPSRLAELLPPAALLPALDRVGLWTRLSGWFDVGPAERAAAVAQKLHGNAEILSAKKAAAVMASTAALAGGAAVEHQVAHPNPRSGTETNAQQEAPRTETPHLAARPATPSVPAVSDAGAAVTRAAAERERRARAKQGEFSFETAGSTAVEASAAGSSTASASTSGSSQAPAAAGGGSEFSGPGSRGSGGGAGGEFGP